MFRGSVLSQGIRFLLPVFSGGDVGARLEAEAVIPGFKDVAVVGEAVEECRCHLGIAEDASPFAEAEVGGDDDAGLLVELAEHMEQQRPA